jgi:hypothetical protein
LADFQKSSPLKPLGQMSILYRGPSIDASYQVPVHLAMLFQRRRFLEIDQSENWSISKNPLL